MRVALAFAAVASSAWCLSFAACGSTSDSESADDSGINDGAHADGSSSNDGSSPNDASVVTDGSTTTDGSTLHVDDGGFFNSDFAVSIVGNIVGTGASFSAPSPLSDECPVIAAGDCLLFDCAAGQLHQFATDSQSAGTLTVAGGAPNEVVTLTLQADHAFEGFAFDASVFAPASTITFKATGDVVPAFTQTLMLPSSPTLTSPVTSAGSITIDRSSDFPVTWSGGNADVVGVAIVASGSPKQIACEFPASASSGVIPSVLLTHLPAGAGQASFLGYAKTIANEGAFVVRFQAGNLLDSGEVTATLD